MTLAITMIKMFKYFIILVKRRPNKPRGAEFEFVVAKDLFVPP